ncbi:MAG: hypothetical protein P8N61_01865 [Porticoccaceae bacterium]|nr:hypothetical protein [Porticoccaceae bacterium]
MSNVTNFHQQSSSEPTPLVIEIWARLIELYPVLSTRHGVKSVPIDWQQVISPLSSKDIERVWPRMKKDFLDFPPTPMRFAILCQPRAEDVGFPNDEMAYQQAIGNLPEKHPAVAYTRSLMGSMASLLTQMNDKTARSTFLSYYHEVIGKVDDGFEIPFAIAETISEAENNKSPENLRQNKIFMELIAKLFGLDA